MSTAFCPRSSTTSFRHYHLRFKTDFRRVGLTRMMEQVANVSCASARIAHRHRGIHERLIGKCAHESDRVRQVGLAHAIRACNASERAELHVDVNEVLKPFT